MIDAQALRLKRIASGEFTHNSPIMTMNSPSHSQALRLKRMASGQAVYMGKWEVTDEAVDVAMSELRKQALLLLFRPGGDQPHQAATRAAGYG